MRPDQTLNAVSNPEHAHDELNQVLALSGLRIGQDGRIRTDRQARTVREARERTERLRTYLEHRGAHAEVLRHCRAELLRRDYYEAVFEAVKGLGARLRALGGVDLDGHRLVDAVLGGRPPMFRLNAGRTDTERNEQLGVTNLAKGIFSAFRNPIGHEPRIAWTLDEQDALDVLGTLSLIHRRLDSGQLSS